MIVTVTGYRSSYDSGWKVTLRTCKVLAVERPVANEAEVSFA